MTVAIPLPDGRTMPALHLPAPGAPTLVLLQEIFGVTDYVRGRAADLAALGYGVVVPQVYWRLAAADGRDEWVITETDAGALEQAIGLVGRLDWDAAVADAAATVRWARDGGRVGLVGFCFGGGLAFNTAAVEPVDALVSYYGSALPGLIGLADRVTVPSLHHFGEADSYIPMETVAAVRDAVSATADVEFHTYPGAAHAFDGAVPSLHDAVASALAWERTVAFLRRTLPVGATHDGAP